MAEKEDATMDDKAFREAFVSEITEYAKEAERTNWWNCTTSSQQTKLR
jgi:hypothetical protein